MYKNNMKNSDLQKLHKNIIFFIFLIFAHHFYLLLFVDPILEQLFAPCLFPFIIQCIHLLNLLHNSCLTNQNSFRINFHQSIS